MTNADINARSGKTPTLVATDSNSLTIGTDGTGDCVVLAGGHERLRVPASGFVVTNPPSGTGQNALSIDAYGTEPSYPVLYGRRARGTKEAPTAAQSGDHLLVIAGRSYGATGFTSNSNAAIFFAATENQTDSAHGCEVVVEVTATGAAATSRAPILKLSKSSATAHTITLGPSATANLAIAIQPNTADAADTASVTLSGGGAYALDGSRGACVLAGGNDSGSYPGQWHFNTGNSSAFSHFNIRLNNAASAVRIKNSSDAEMWAITSDITQNASAGGNVLLSRQSTAVGQPIATGLTAAGTVIGDALDLTAVYSDVTTVAANSGVQLWAAPVGACLMVRNSGANDLKVYPDGATGTINGGGAGAAVTVAVGEIGAFIHLTSGASGAWIGGVMAAF